MNFETRVILGELVDTLKPISEYYAMKTKAAKLETKNNLSMGIWQLENLLKTQQEKLEQEKADNCPERIILDQEKYIKTIKSMIADSEKELMRYKK